MDAEQIKALFEDESNGVMDDGAWIGDGLHDVIIDGLIDFSALALALGVLINEGRDKGRGGTESCASCRYSSQSSKYGHSVTTCRKSAPTHGEGWPFVSLGDWCGEFSVVGADG